MIKARLLERGRTMCQEPVFKVAGASGGVRWNSAMAGRFDIRLSDIESDKRQGDHHLRSLSRAIDNWAEQWPLPPFSAIQAQNEDRVLQSRTGTTETH